MHAGDEESIAIAINVNAQYRRAGTRFFAPNIGYQSGFVTQRWQLLHEV